VPRTSTRKARSQLGERILLAAATGAAAIMRESIAGRRLMTVSAVHHLYAVKRENAH
jgi:hypothetical protein